MQDLSNQNLSPDSIYTHHCADPYNIATRRLPTTRTIPVVLWNKRIHQTVHIYYHSHDILLTTEAPLQWRKEDGLNIFGTTVVALLMQVMEAVAYKNPCDFGSFLQEKHFPSTGFVEAIRGANPRAGSLSVLYLQIARGQERKNGLNAGSGSTKAVRTSQKQFLRKKFLSFVHLVGRTV